MRPFLVPLLLLVATVYARADDGALVRPVNQTLIGDNSLAVLPLLELGPQFKGREVQQLLLKAHSEDGKGIAAAAIGGSDVTAFQTLDAASGKTYVFELPENARVIGAQELQLHLRGRVVVEAVGVRLFSLAQPGPRPPLPNPNPQPNPQPQPSPPRPTPPAPPAPPAPQGPHETIFLRQYFQGTMAFPLARLTDFSAHAGRILRKVTVTGVSRLGDAQLTLCVDEGCSGAVMPAQRSALQWNMNDPVGGRAATWQLNSQGELYLERIDFDYQ